MKVGARLTIRKSKSCTRKRKASSAVAAKPSFSRSEFIPVAPGLEHCLSGWYPDPVRGIVLPPVAGQNSSLSFKIARVVHQCAGGRVSAGIADGQILFHYL